jgi:hypothetical protein
MEEYISLFLYMKRMTELANASFDNDDGAGQRFRTKRTATYTDRYTTVDGKRPSKEKKTMSKKWTA